MPASGTTPLEGRPGRGANAARVALPQQPTRAANRKLDLLALGLLALACLGFYWRILLGGAWMPSGGGDLVSFLWPTYTFAARSLRSGVLPLWNPYL